ALPPSQTLRPIASAARQARLALRRKITVADLSSAPDRRSLDGRHGPLDDGLDAERPQCRAGPARIAVYPVARLQPLGAHQARIERQHQRGIGEPGVGPDLACLVAFGFQQMAKASLALAVIVEDRMRPRRTVD